MYLSKLTISGFRQFGLGDAAAELTFQPGVAALIGKNDSGKTAIIDAVRYALLSRDQMYFKVQPEDFHVDAAGSRRGFDRGKPGKRLFLGCRFDRLQFVRQLERCRPQPLKT
jgi:predicted ATP-dependent endonuclease of OLD family